MKQLYIKSYIFFIIISAALPFKSIGQSTQVNANVVMGTINTTGADATGSEGSVTYSIGQVFYSFIDQSSFTVAQGVQQEDVANTLAMKKNATISSVTAIVYPNPTVDFVNLKMEGFDRNDSSQSYQLYDLLGRIVDQSIIKQDETQINLNNLSPAIYILQVNANNKVLKTFKILKK